MCELLARRGLVDDCLRAPELWRDVVAECMRHRAMFPVALPRRARRDVTIGDRVIPAPTVVLPSLLAAARDPAHTPDPHQFVPRRDKAQTNIVFGAGSHFCHGAAHTALWLEISLRPFFQRFPQPRTTQPSTLQWQSGTLSTLKDQPPGATRHQHQHAAPGSARPGARNPRSKPRAQEWGRARTSDLRRSTGMCTIGRPRRRRSSVGHPPEPSGGILARLINDLTRTPQADDTTTAI